VTLTKKRSVILIDGSNFYHRLKKLGFYNQLDFDYSRFVKFISKNERVVKSTYYVGRIRAQERNKKSQELLANQNRLISKLRSHNVQIKLGYLLRVGNTYHEKGVDVQIAVDLAVGAFKNKFDVAYLVSSDSDLIPAINASISAGKKVVYVGFKKNPSYALYKSCKKSILLGRGDLLPFFE